MSRDNTALAHRLHRLKNSPTQVARRQAALKEFVSRNLDRPPRSWADELTEGIALLSKSGQQWLAEAPLRVFYQHRVTTYDAATDKVAQHLLHELVHKCGDLSHAPNEIFERAAAEASLWKKLQADARRVTNKLARANRDRVLERVMEQRRKFARAVLWFRATHPEINIRSLRSLLRRLPPPSVLTPYFKDAEPADPVTLKLCSERQLAEFLRRPNAPDVDAAKKPSDSSFSEIEAED